MPYKADEPVVMALYRFEDRNEFEDRLNKMRVTKLPAVVHGVFDEKNERCIVDFANKRLGGGWLSYGCVQEEIMFIERPDFGASVCPKFVGNAGSPSGAHCQPLFHGSQ